MTARFYRVTAMRVAVSRRVMRLILGRVVLAALFAAGAQAAGAADADVAARVNDVPVTEKELEEAIDQLIPKATFHGSVTEEKRAEFRDRALNGLIDRELQRQDAIAKGLKPDKKLVKERMSAVRERFKTKKEYKRALELAGVTEDELRARVEKAVLVETVVARTTVEPAVLADDQLKEYYDKNPEKFRQPESVKLRIITLSDEKKAREALERIKAGADFGDVAYAVSEDPYRVKGGEVGAIHRGRILQELEDVAFKLAPGELSGVVKAEGAWFLMRVEEKIPERQLTFAESKDRLKKELETKRSAELLRKWMEGLRLKAKIEIP